MFQRINLVFINKAHLIGFHSDDVYLLWGVGVAVNTRVPI